VLESVYKFELQKHWMFYGSGKVFVMFSGTSGRCAAKVTLRYFCPDMFETFFGAKKATRVAHSSSHAESVAAIGVTQIGQLLAYHMSEPFTRTILGYNTIPKDVLRIPEVFRPIVPADRWTDCMDLYELCCGHRGIANDKNPRIVFMALREDRLRANTRTFLHIPIVAILADGLTNVGTFATSEVSLDRTHGNRDRTRRDHQM
jgi:hypothetical protein